MGSRFELEVAVSMEKLKKTEVTQGVCWVEATEAELFILCGCPEDAVRVRIKGKT